MLIRFNVKNFLSFSDRLDPFDGNNRISHEFSMIPGSVRNKEDHVIQNSKQKLLKFAAIYGANAAGKSNVVKAIEVFQQFILLGNPPMGISSMYSMSRSENKDKSSYFEAEILIENEIFAYGFEVVLTSGMITSEWLYRVNPASDKLIFERTSSGYTFGSELKDISDLKVIGKSFFGSFDIYK